MAATSPLPQKKRWTAADSIDLYNVAGWGNNYFSVNDLGNLVVHPGGPGTPSIDLKELVDEVRERGIGLPLCNGYKDNEYVEMALLASRIGRTIVLVVEKPSEFPLIRDIGASSVARSEGWPGATC